MPGRLLLQRSGRLSCTESRVGGTSLPRRCGMRAWAAGRGRTRWCWRPRPTARSAPTRGCMVQRAGWRCLLPDRHAAQYWFMLRATDRLPRARRWRGWLNTTGGIDGTVLNWWVGGRGRGAGTANTAALLATGGAAPLPCHGPLVWPEAPRGHPPFDPTRACLPSHCRQGGPAAPHLEPVHLRCAARQPAAAGAEPPEVAEGGAPGTRRAVVLRSCSAGWLAGWLGEWASICPGCSGLPGCPAGFGF